MLKIVFSSIAILVYLISNLTDPQKLQINLGQTIHLSLPSLHGENSIVNDSTFEHILSRQSEATGVPSHVLAVYLHITVLIDSKQLTHKNMESGCRIFIKSIMTSIREKKLSPKSNIEWAYLLKEYFQYNGSVADITGLLIYFEDELFSSVAIL